MTNIRVINDDLLSSTYKIIRCNKLLHFNNFAMRACLIIYLEGC